MQPRSLLRLRQGHLVRLRPARGLGLRQRPDGAAVHLPLNGTQPSPRAEPSSRFAGRRLRPDAGRRRRLVGVGTAAVLFVLYVALGGGFGSAPGLAWFVVVGAVAAVGGAVLADFLPRAGQSLRDAVGRAPCAAMPAMTTVGAGLLIASAPGSASMALAALAIVVFGLVQRRTTPVVACATR